MKRWRRLMERWRGATERYAGESEINAIPVHEILRAAGQPDELPEWVYLAMSEPGGSAVDCGATPRIEIAKGAINVHSDRGTMRADPGDWLVCGVKGELYSFSSESFEAIFGEALSEDDVRDKMAW